jgi:hypothetical protein
MQEALEEPIAGPATAGRRVGCGHGWLFFIELHYYLLGIELQTGRGQRIRFSFRGMSVPYWEFNTHLRLTPFDL